MSSKDYEEMYEKLRRNGVATVENIVKWLKDAQILEKADKTEEQAAEMFKQIQDDNEVALETFLKVLEELARQAQTTTEELAEQLMAASELLIEALIAAGTAFSSTLLASRPDPSEKK